jgi:hypothetical protein
MPSTRASLTLFVFAIGASMAPGASYAQDPIQYRVLATTRTSTMEKELAEAGAAGFRFAAVMGGDTALGGKEVVIVMGKWPGLTHRFEYRLLATARTSTMQRELQEAADAGYAYVGQSVFQSAFGGREVVCILEREPQPDDRVKYEYRLLATSRTSTMENELREAGRQGFEIVGMTVGQTSAGGTELVVITRRRAG